MLHHLVSTEAWKGQTKDRLEKGPSWVLLRAKKGTLSRIFSHVQYATSPPGATKSYTLDLQQSLWRWGVSIVSVVTAAEMKKQSYAQNCQNKKSNKMNVEQKLAKAALNKKRCSHKGYLALIRTIMQNNKWLQCSLIYKHTGCKKHIHTADKMKKKSPSDFGLVD